jgi:hypothetical protein
MSNPSWLEKLAPSELQLLRDLAEVVKRTALSDVSDEQRMMTAEIRQEIERRSKNNNLISYEDAGNTPLKARLKSRKVETSSLLNGKGAGLSDITG